MKVSPLHQRTMVYTLEAKLSDLIYWWNEGALGSSSLSFVYANTPSLVYL